MKSNHHRCFRAASMIFASFMTAAALAATVADGPDFDQNIQTSPLLKEATLLEKNTPGPKGRAIASQDGLWISLDNSDLAPLVKAGFPFNQPAAQREQDSLFQVEPKLLPRLSRFMHRQFNRCGGFFAYRTREEADLIFPTAASGPFTIDNETMVKPLVSNVREGELRSTIETLAAFNNRFFTSDTGVEAARWIKDRWQALAKDIPGASAELIAHKGWSQPSVILTIPGSEKPDEIVVLGGHLDSINTRGGAQARAPGADDNASGIAVLTETLRVLAETGFRPKRTVQFMGYAAEEVGLRGSQDIARQYARDGKKVVGVIQFDMSNFKGASKDIYLLTDNVDSSLTTFLGKLIDAYVGVQWTTMKCGYGCSDHASWTRNGFPSSMAFESTMKGMNNKIHTANDTLANSGGNAAHSVHFAKLGVAFAVEVAKTAGFKSASVK